MITTENMLQNTLQFREIIGNDAARSFLKNAAMKDAVPHAMLLLGEDGWGKHTLAGAFAMSLFCGDTGEEACGVCADCKMVRTLSHPDLYYVRPEKKTMGVDVIRNEINDRAAIRPFRSEHKLFIVSEADKMTEEAQNALLKTLEEPPEYAVILLLAESSDAFLETILSRCILLRLCPKTREEIRTILESRGADPDQIKAAEVFSCGNIGRALRLTEDAQYRAWHQELLSRCLSVREQGPAELTGYAGELLKSCHDPLDALKLAEHIYYSVLMEKLGRGTKGCTAETDRQLRTAAQQWSVDSLCRASEIIEETSRRIRANVNAENSIALMMIKLREC